MVLTPVTMRVRIVQILLGFRVLSCNRVAAQFQADRITLCKGHHMIAAHELGTMTQYDTACKGPGDL